MKVKEKLKQLLTRRRCKDRKLLVPCSNHRFYMFNIGELFMSQSNVSEEQIVCPTCECLPNKETLALKQIKINQKLDETTSDAIVLPYYSLVPPFHTYEEKAEGNKKELNDRVCLGVMSNKKGKSAVKKLYLSVYGTVEKVVGEEGFLLLKPVADFKKENDKVRKECVTGLDLLAATSVAFSDKKDNCDGKVLGRKLLRRVERNTYFDKEERLEGIKCYFTESQPASYDDQLNRVPLAKLEGKLVIAIIDYCLLYHHQENFVEVHFIRSLGEDEGKKAVELVQKYYYG